MERWLWVATAIIFILYIQRAIKKREADGNHDRRDEGDCS